MTAHPITILLASLSNARLGAQIGLWMDSPDLAGWLLQNGQFHSWKGPGDKLPVPGIKWGRKARCFEEAMRVALKHSDLTYCEGYAQTETRMVPTPHAWCLTRGGRVVDNTWRSGKGDAERDERGYFGVPFRTDFVRNFYHEDLQKELSLLLWSEAGWPIQNGRIPVSEWRAS